MMAVAGLLLAVVGRPNSTVRFATFNASLHRKTEGQLVADLQSPDDPQAQRVAEIIQRVRPDVLLLCEFDYDAQQRAAELFQKNYLEVSQHGSQPIFYPFRFLAPVNTGAPTGLDLNRNGTTDDPADAFGFGEFPGQYAMVVFSMLPIDEQGVRTFQKFRWCDMPDALHPMRDDGRPYYSADAFQLLRLSSKSFWDLPIAVGNRQVHLLAFHPTPPVFDGREDANGRRNHDEIRLAADYISATKSSYIYDDRGQPGGIDPLAEFVLAGDLNADPLDGESHPGAIDQLLHHRRVGHYPAPASRGGWFASHAPATATAGPEHQGDPRGDTADFGGPDRNLRVDYVLPSAGLRVLRSGVFWPGPEEPGCRLLSLPNGGPTSDHHLVWVDLELDPRIDR
ncbi:MAG: endonuclease/exonuclease/phosphatase family protein [Planctomycetales bacterium]|nr:endonuclease/exonuclease/phosphatase family protein [Planctomycetales bacterium]